MTTETVIYVVGGMVDGWIHNYAQDLFAHARCMVNTGPVIIEICMLDNEYSMFGVYNQPSTNVSINA